jgi:ERCC4-related helicase
MRGGFLVGNQRVTTATIEEAHRRASAAIRRGDKRGYDAAKKIADLRRLHRLIDLLRSQGVLCARAYLDRAEDEGRSSRKTGRFLGLPHVHLLRQRIEKMDEIHPKPALVQRSIRQSLRRNPEGRIIVFTEYRDTVDILCNLLSADSRLKVGRFVGQTTKGTRTGMSQKKQLEQLSRFREGELNILVATSVAEEGLDVPNADRVILYEPVPSAIRAIQRRGRTARQRSGDVHILIANGSRDEFVQRAAAAREAKMHKTLNRIIRQARLPRRTPPGGHILDRFTIQDDKSEISAEEFIDRECKRLLTRPAAVQEEVIVQKSKTTSPAFPISSRPRSQMGLEAFVDYESPVDKDTKKQADAAAAAMSEIDAIDPEKKSLQD